MTETGGNQLLEAALAYAARGWPVYPCNPRTKEPLVARDKDAGGKSIPKTGGIAKATTDAATISGWWSRWPKAIVTAAMGPAAGVFALDFDPRVDDDTGEEWTLERLKGEVEAQIGVALPETATALSPSGGVHLYFRWPASGPAITGRASLPPHVDVRGQGGGCNLPPSVRADGRPYRWLRDLDALADAPAALLAVLQVERPAAAAPVRRAAIGEDAEAVRLHVEKYALAALQAECRAVETCGSGGRNAQLNKSAFAVAGLVAATLSSGAGVLNATLARAMLLEAAKANPGRDDGSQIEATLDSGWTSGLAAPRDLGKVEGEAVAFAERKAAGQGRGRAPAGARTAARLRPEGPTTNNARDAGGGASASSSDAAPAPGPRPPVGSETESSQMGGSAQPGSETGGGGEAIAAAELERRCAFRPLTEVGNAERWRDRHADNFRFCPTVGWHAWDGRRWSRDDADTLLAISVVDTIRSIQDEAAAIAEAGGDFERWCVDYGPLPPLGDPDRDAWHDTREAAWKAHPIGAAWGHPPDPVVKATRTAITLRSQQHRAWGRTSESDRMTKAIRSLILRYVTVKLASFDADPMKLNVANGTLVFAAAAEPADPNHFPGPAAVTMLAHNRADLITMLADVVYDERAAAPVFDAFLARVQPDAEVRRFLDAYAGYCLTGDTSEQVFVINHGALGANGKSTWVNSLAHVMGDYSISVPIEVFLDSGRTRQAGAPSPDLAELPRRRLVRTGEPKARTPFAEDLLKLVTGEDVIRARHLGLGFFEFSPEFKIVVSMNPAPQLSSDAATWRRTRIVPWDVSIPPAERDPDLAAKLRAEAPGILARVVRGTLDWLTDGLPASTAIEAATREQRDSSDPLGVFLERCTAIDPEGRAPATPMLKTFNAWGEWAGAIGRPWSAKGFAAAMADKGHPSKKSSTVWYPGLRLVADPGDFADPEAGPRDDAGWPDPP